MSERLAGYYIVLRLALRLCLACIGTELQRWMMSRVFYSVLILGTLLVHDALAMIKCGYMSMLCQRMAVRAAVPMDSRDLVV